MSDSFLLSLLFQTQFSDKPVQDRGLVVTDIKAEDVVLEHRSYCSARARERNFAGEVLGYVTPVSRGSVVQNRAVLLALVFSQLLLL